MKKYRRSAIVAGGIILCAGLFACNKNDSAGEATTQEVTSKEDASQTQKETEKQTEKESDASLSSDNVLGANDPNKVDIIDIESNIRPIVISVNNIDVAQIVQRGLNDAYMVYELPVEGGITRCLAFYKDPTIDVQVGSVRSARHNMFDIAMESDAIICHYGGSTIATSQEADGVIDYISGMEGGPFWRENPENIASEHTVNTSTAQLFTYAAQKGYVTSAETAEQTILLNYDNGDVDLSGMASAIKADTVTATFSSVQNSVFKYDEDDSCYYRWNGSRETIDYGTKEQVNCENIIIQYFTYTLINDKLLDFNNIGTGTGFYITNGYAVPINWSKESRSAKTVYTYADTGEEITVSDGRTFIELFPAQAALGIE